MTKLNKYILTIVVAMLFTSCYDLDRYPLDKPSSQTFWQNDDQARMGVMGIYSQMKETNLFGITFSTDCLSDIGLGFDPQGYFAIATGVYTNRDGQVQGKWQSTYQGIMTANNVIRNVSNSTLISDPIKTKVLAEAKFLRALFYSHLLDYYGGVPLYDETVELEKDYNNLLLKRSTIADTRSFILKDLADAIAGLPVSWDLTDYGRATKGAAYALRGKVYLFAKDYPNAVKDFEEIVLKSSVYGYGLYPDYDKLFVPKGLGGGDRSNEMIFAIQNSGGVGTSYGMPMTFYMGTRSSFGSCWNNSMPSTDLMSMYEYKDGKPFDWNDLIPNFKENNAVKKETFVATLTSNAKAVATYPKNYSVLTSMYSQRDPRMGQTIILPYTNYLGWSQNAPKPCVFVVAAGVNETNGFIRNNKGWNTYFWRKFVPEANMGGLLTDRAHTPVNFPLIRYADVLLMLAESYNETSRYDDAVKYINQVRQRPSTNLPALNSGPVWLEARTKDEIFKRIMKERAVEFAGEGLRFNDLKRWKVAESLLASKKELQITGELALNRSFGARDYLWPIPAVEIEINPALEQNPGW